MAKKKDNGNGHNDTLDALQQTALLDAKKSIDEMMTEEGFGSMPFEQKLGVMQRMVTAVANDAENRQILLLAAFDDKREALLAADAIAERERYGVPIKPILDRVVAQCAVKADRVRRILEAMSSYQLNTNMANKVPDWKRKQENKAI